MSKMINNREAFTIAEINAMGNRTIKYNSETGVLVTKFGRSTINYYSEVSPGYFVATDCKTI